MSGTETLFVVRDDLAVHSGKQSSLWIPGFTCHAYKVKPELIKMQVNINQVAFNLIY